MRAAAALAGAVWLVTAASAGAQSAAGGVVRTEPGSSPAVTASPATAVPLLTYAALGLSGVAVVLGGVALALALAGRRGVEDLAAAVRPRPAPALDPRSAERLSRLEVMLDGLAAAPAAPRRPSAEPVASSRDPFPPPAPAAATRPGGGAPSAAPATLAPAERLSAWVDELKARFARLALDPSSSAAGFIADHHPRGALAGPDGVALLDGFEGAKLWAVRAPGEGEIWALMPGEQAVLNWTAHFAAQRTQVAAEVFGEAFDLVEGGSGLRLEEPALARRDASGRLSVRRRGRLSGFRG